MPRMPLRTRLLTYALDHGPYPKITDLDVVGIQTARTKVPPLRRPFTWITGGMPPGVQVSEAWFPVLICR